MKNGQIKKEPRDAYGTPRDLAALYTDRAIDYWGSSSYLEPSAGAGPFVDALVARGLSVQAYDIEPLHPLVERRDFFSLTDELEGKVLIGNPPFGKGGSMALKFMNHAISNGVIGICMLLPACIGHKHFTLKTLSPKAHLVYEEEMDKDRHFQYLDDRIIEGENPVRCFWQHWEIREEDRQDPQYLRETESFEILQPGTKKVKIDGKQRELPVGPIDADLTVVSHGPKAGSVLPFSPEHKANVKMFLRVKEGHTVSEVKEQIESSDLYHLRYSTIRHNPSIAPSELIEAVG